MLKSFRFFWVATILCAGCAKRAAMYQKAKVGWLPLSTMCSSEVAGLVEAEARSLPRHDSWPCGTSWKSSSPALG